MQASTGLSICAVALSAASLTLPCVLQIGLVAETVQTDAHALALLATTVGLSAALAAIAGRAQSVRAAWLWLLLAPVMGVLNTVLALAAVVLLNGAGGEMYPVFWLGSIYGVIFGAPLGIVFGLAYAVPIVAAVRARVKPSHDGADRVLAAAGAFVAAAGAIGLGLETLLPAAVRMDKSDLVFMGPFVALAVGFAGLAVSVARRVRRARWVRAVAAQQVPDFCIVERDPAMPPNVVLPLFRAEPSGCDLVVMRVDQRPAPGAPYRSGSRAPFALLRSVR